MKQRPLPAALRWVPRWRAAARIARRDAARHRGRTALVAVLVALPLVAGSASLVLIESLEPTDASIVRDALGSTVQARITAVCGGTFVPDPGKDKSQCVGGHEPEQRSADEMDAVFAAALPAGSTVFPLRSALVDYVAGERSRVARDYAELDLSGESLRTATALEQGRLPEDATEILVSGHMARSAPLGLGDSVALRPASDGASATASPVELTVVGISRVGAGIPADFVGLPGSALDPFDAGELPSTWYVTGDLPVGSESAEKLYALGFQVLSQDADVHASGGPQFSLFDNRLMSLMPSGNPSAVTLAAAAAIVLLEFILLIGPAFVIGARRETRNLALVAATGGEPADLRRIVLSTGLVVGGGAAVGGTVIGAVAGAALVPAMRTRDIYVPNLAVPVPELLLLALAGTALALAAAWFPARQAARTDIVSALSGRRPDTSVSRRRPVAGFLSLGAGIVAAIVGALMGWIPVLVLGFLVLEIGVIATSASAVRALGRRAHRASLVIRYALRDADRHRTRTAPALAAIIAATAVAGAGVTFQASYDASWQRLDMRSATVGTLIVGLTASSSAPSEDDGTPVNLDEGVEIYEEFLVGTLGEVPVTEVRAAVPSRAGQSRSIERLRPRDEGCPTLRHTQDPRCSTFAWGSTPFNLSGAHDDSVIVDDGSAIRALGLPDSDAVADALATEHAVVASRRDLWTEADGSTFAHLAVPGLDEPIVVPAVAHTWGEVRYRLILPPAVVSEIGWTTAPVGLVVPRMGDITDAQRSDLRNLPKVPGIYALAEIQKEGLRPSNRSLVPMVIGTILLSVLATWIVVGLAASESRPDLATISAVGASPRTRRLLAGAQAGVLVVVGTFLGLVTGVFFGGMLVLSERQLAGGAGWAWRLDVPWLLLALLASTAPLLAIGGATLTTRSRLPVTRRLAS